MTGSDPIQPVSASRPDLHAFRITGTVTRDAMAAMGERMLDAFDAAAARDATVDMLLIFDGYEGAEPLAGLSWPALKSRAQSLVRVDRYVTANAPEAAGAMIEALGAIIPVEARAFDDAAEAWAFLDARPA